MRGAEAQPSVGQAAVPAGASSRRMLLWIGAIWLLTLAAYQPAMGNGYIWDDDQHVMGNGLLRSAEGLGRVWLEPRATPQYYPLVHTSFWMEYQLWGLDPAGYHLVNVLLHAANAMLVFLVLRRLKLPGGDWAAWLAGVLFAIHPVHVESVAWITERKNVLSGLFYLLALGAAVRVWGLDDAEGGAKRDWKAYGVCAVLFVCALLSKSVTASLPAVILLAAWWRHGRITGRDVGWSLPLFALGVAAGVHTVWLEHGHVGASGGVFDLSVVQRVLIAGRAACSYLGHTFWPDGLMFIYPRWVVDASQGWQYLYPAGIVVLGGVLWCGRGRIGRGPIVALLFFLGTLLPALGFVNIFPFRFSFVADHFQYLASVGILALVASVLVVAIGRMRGRWGWLPVAAGVIAGAVVVMLAVVTRGETFKYRDEVALWTQTLQRNPGAAIAYNNLGMMRKGSGDGSGALEYFLKAVEIDPSLAEAWTNAGGMVMGMGDAERAEGMFRRSLELSPRFGSAWLGLGGCLLVQNRPGDAVGPLEEACKYSPGNAECFYALGVALDRSGQGALAGGSLERALALNGEDAKTQYAAGVHYCGQKQVERGVLHLREAVRLRPDWKDAAEALRAAEAGRVPGAATGAGSATEPG